MGLASGGGPPRGIDTSRLHFGASFQKLLRVGYHGQLTKYVCGRFGPIGFPCGHGARLRIPGHAVWKYPEFGRSEIFRFFRRAHPCSPRTIDWLMGAANNLAINDVLRVTSGAIDLHFVYLGFEAVRATSCRPRRPPALRISRRAESARATDLTYVSYRRANCSMQRAHPESLIPQYVGGRLPIAPIPTSPPRELSAWSICNIRNPPQRAPDGANFPTASY